MILGSLSFLALASCASLRPPANAPLNEGKAISKECAALRASLPESQKGEGGSSLLNGPWSPCIQYRPGIVASPPGVDHSEDVLLLFAVSGGAKRSAAFSYGVFEALRDAPLDLGDGKPRRILSEVDMMTASSGGALTASFYALNRDRMFEEEWPNKDCSYLSFLHEDTGAEIWNLYLQPWQWGWAFDSSYGSNDRMAKFYAQRLFGSKAMGGKCAGLMASEGPYGANFSDLYKQGPPILMLQSTDVTQAIPFPFTQDSFDLLCSDLSDYPLAWAVAASNAFPVVLSAIALKNHNFAKREKDRDQRSQPACKPQGNSWLYEKPSDGLPGGVIGKFADKGCNRETLLEGPDAEGVEAKPSVPPPTTFFRGDLLESVAACRLWPENGSHVHLADGGLMDNMALQGLTDWLQTHTDLADPVFWAIVLKTRRVQLVLIDGQSATNMKLAEKEEGPNLWDSLGTMVSTTVEQGNLDSFVRVGESLLILNRLLAIRDVVMLEESANSRDYDEFEALLCPSKSDPASPAKVAGGDEPCLEGRMTPAKFDELVTKFVADNKDIAKKASERKDVGVRIAEYFRLREAGEHDLGPSRWKKESWDEYTTLKRKLRLLTNWRYRESISVFQTVRLSLSDDCNAQRRERLLGSETGLGISTGVIGDAIAAGRDVAARHLAKVTHFLENAETYANPDCGVWLGEKVIEHGASPPASTVR